jgi:hypothetical protein
MMSENTHTKPVQRIPSNAASPLDQAQFDRVDHHSAAPNGAEASLREKLSSQIAGAQADVQSQIVQLRSNGPISGDTLAQMAAQLARLSALQKQIGSADPKDLPTIQSQIAAAVAVAQSVAQQSQSAVTAAKSAQASLAEASEASRKVTNDFVHDFYDKHEFDKYLKFTSANDEEDYREREAQRHKAIELALAKHTPEATLEANRLALEQLKDAGAHGADRSPEYQRRINQLSASATALGGAIENNSTKTQQATANVFDSATPGKTVPPELVASLRDAGVTVPDQSATGHGVALKATSAQQVR